VSGSATSFDDSRRPDGRHTSRPIEPDPAGTGRSETADSGSDWGLSDSKSGMSREMKIGLVLILLLALAFGYVVYRKIQNANDFPDGDGVATTHDRSSRRKRSVEPIPPLPDGGQTTRDERRRARRVRGADGAATSTAQGEPPFGGQTGDSDNGTLPGGNPFQQTSTTTTRDGSATTRDHSTGKVRVGGFPNGQSEPTGGGNPFASQGGGTTTSDGSATTVDHGTKSASPWNLDGKASTNDGSATPGSKPFGGVNGSATTSDSSNSANDGFQNADAAQRRRENPFDRRGRHAARRRELDTRDESAKGVFGGDFEKSGSATTTDNGTTIRDGSALSRDDRLGPYRFADRQRERAGSTTTVQTGGSEFENPFAKPTATGSSNSGLPDGRATTGAPAALDGTDIRYGNDRPRVHVVGYGDNYWSISRQAYGTARYFQVLAEYNRHRISDPRRLRPGMKVLVPTIDVLAARYPKLCPARHARTTLASHTGGRHFEGFFRDPSGSPLFRVGKTDTLSEIAQKHLGRSSRWIQIYHMNRDRIPDPNRLTIGAELRLPADASNIRVVRGGGSIR
jgi:nucleoid-associated protein YgaU